MSAERFMNKFLMNLKPYRSVSQEIWEKDPHEWDGILKLDWNESTIEPSIKIRKAIEKYWDEYNFLHLYPCTYNSELLRVISSFANVPSENIQYFSSSDSLHEYICKCYIQINDTVLLLWPSYDNFRLTAEANGARIFHSEMSYNYEISLDKLLNDIVNSSAKLVYICNPNNPTGGLIKKDDVRMLLEACPQTLFLIDEAYSEFAYHSVNDLVLSYDNILVTHTLSKAFGLANIRFGYLVSSKDHIDIISRIRNPKNISSFAQIAAISALEDVGYMWKYVDEVNKAREWFCDSLKNNNKFNRFVIYPSKANFVLVKCPSIEIKAKIYYSLREKKIYVRQLNQTSALLECIRITVGTRSQMKRVYDVLNDIICEI